MRIKISIIGVLIGLLLLCVGTIGSLSYYMQKYKSLSDVNYNNYVELRDSTDRVLAITAHAFGRYLDEHAELKAELTKERIKKSKVREVTIIENVYHTDTVTMEVAKFDVTKKAYPITFDTDCLKMKGYVDVDSIVHVWYDDITFKNTTTVICYEKRKPTGRRFLFFNIKKKYLELHTKNSCGESKVEQLNVIKK